MLLIFCGGSEGEKAEICLLCMLECVRVLCLLLRCDSDPGGDSRTAEPSQAASIDQQPRRGGGLMFCCGTLSSVAPLPLASVQQQVII